MSRRPRAYLSGGMQFAKGSGASWRRAMRGWLASTLGHEAVDPVVASAAVRQRLVRKGWKLPRGDRRGGDWPRFFRTIVKHDIALVRSSDYIICFWNTSARRGAGTQGELTIARDVALPVYLVSRTRLEELPGWVQGCVTRWHPSFKSLQQFLVQHHTRRRGAANL